MCLHVINNFQLKEIHSYGDIPLHIYIYNMTKLNFVIHVCVSEGLGFAPTDGISEG